MTTVASSFAVGTALRSRVSTARVPAARRGCPVAVRAEAQKPSTEVQSVDTSASGTVFYGGKTYNDTEWEAAVRDGSAQRNAVDGASSSAVAISDVMAFSGAAPEIVNGRLAMLGFVSAVGAELNSDVGVLKQWASEPTLITLTFVLFMAGSLVPILANKKESLGPFTPSAEMLNGRAAMIGFAALIAAEVANGGSALF